MHPAAWAACWRKGRLAARPSGLSCCLLSVADAQLLWLHHSNTESSLLTAPPWRLQPSTEQQAFQGALMAEIWSSLLTPSLGVSVSASWRRDPAASAAWWQ